MLRLRDEVRSAPLAASLSMTNVAARRAKALSCWSGARGPRSGPLAEAKYPYLTQGVRHERAPPESRSLSTCPSGYISIRPTAPILVCRGRSVSGTSIRRCRRCSGAFVTDASLLDGASNNCQGESVHRLGDSCKLQNCSGLGA